MLQLLLALVAFVTLLIVTLPLHCRTARHTVVPSTQACARTPATLTHKTSIGAEFLALRCPPMFAATAGTLALGHDEKAKALEAAMLASAHR